MTLRRTLTAALVPLMLLAGAMSSSAQSPEADALPAHQIHASDDDILILEVMIDRYRASQGVLAYRHEDEAFLPLGQISGVLEMAIRVQPMARTASGWITSDDEPFALDLESARVEFDGHVEGLPDASIYVGFDDIYVRASTLSRWIPASFEIDWARMRIDVQASDTLPLVARLERDRLRARLMSNRPAEPIYPQRDADYRAYAWPFIDVTVREQGNDSRRSESLSLLGRADLGGMNATGFLLTRNGTKRQTTGWLNFQRQAMNGSLLGPLGATRVSVGDVFAPSVPGVASGRRGQGLVLSNRSINQRRFSMTEVEGPADVDWDAELYVNGRLVAFQTVDETGRYRFNDIPVYSGRSLLRVVLYGPQGQEREEIHRVTTTQNAGDSGQLLYEFHALQNGTSILGADIPSGNPASLGEWVHHLALGYGIDHTLDFELSVDRVPVKGEASDFIGLRGNKTVGASLFHGTLVKNLQSGHYLKTGVNTNLLNHGVLAQIRYSDQYRTADAGIDGSARWAGSLRVEGSTQRLLNHSLSYHVDANHVIFDESSPGSNSSLKLRGNTRVASLSLLHSIQANRLAREGASNRHSLSGSQLVAGGYGRLRLRGSLNYRYDREFTLQNLGVDVHRMLNQDFDLRVRLDRLFQEPASTRINTTLNWRSSAATIGLRAGVDTDGLFNWGITVSSGLTAIPELDIWSASARSVTRGGGAVVRTFIDQDGDGRFSESDEPIEGIRFRRNRAWRALRTDESGRAWLGSIQPSRRVNVEIDMASVFDPFLVPRHEGLATIVHPGGVAHLDFPFSFVGDVEGAVYRDLLRRRPMRDVGLELIDPEGKRIASAVSEFDGYYIFQGVPPGAYKVRVVAATLPYGDFILPPPEPVVVPARGDFVEGPEIVLVREGEKLDLDFAEDGALEELLPPDLRGKNISETVLARIRQMLDADLTDAPSLESLLDDPSLTEAERRTVRILHELFFGDDGVYWLSR